MAASITDTVSKYSNGSQPLPTQLSAEKTSGATTASISAATGWDTSTIKFVRMYQTEVVNGQTVPDQSTICFYKATLSGTTLSDLTLVWSATGSDQTYPAGSTVDLSVSAGYTDALASNILTHADQDGTLKAGAVDVAGVIASDIITNTQMATAVKPETNFTETTFDFVASGCVWSGDAYGSTRNASMTAGVVYIGGRRVVVSAVTSRTFTASKDVYVDVDNTGTLTYTDTTTNAASPALAANSIRLGIIVVGASNIAAVGSVNQGQVGKVLPIASSIPYMKTDSLGNLICPRDPNRKLLGYRQIVGNVTFTTIAQVTGLSCPVIVPTGRDVKVTAYVGASTNPAVSSVEYTLWDGAVSGGTQLVRWRELHAIAGNSIAAKPEATVTPSTASKTYNLGGAVDTNTETVNADATTVAWIKVELA